MNSNTNGGNAGYMSNAYASGMNQNTQSGYMCAGELMMPTVLDGGNEIDTRT
jgi:hypothetical protein